MRGSLLDATPTLFMNWLLSRFATTGDLFRGTPAWHDADAAIDDAYDTGALLGAGAFASVYELTDARGRVCAAKVFAKRGSMSDGLVVSLPRGADLLRDEVSVSELVGGRRHCVGFLGVLESPSRLILRYELCRGSLAGEIGRAGAGDARRWAFGLLDAVAWAHESGVAHRDVKPENALLAADREVRLGDWGSARRLADGEAFPAGLDEVSGLWAAPEVWRDVPYDARVDEWSCGMVVLALFEGVPDDGAVQQLHVDGVAHAPGRPPDAQALLSLLLAPDPAHRLSAADALGHRWFASG